MLQLRIDASRQTGLLAAQRLSESVRELTESLQACLQIAKRANHAVIHAAIRIAQRDGGGEPATPRRLDKTLLN